MVGAGCEPRREWLGVAELFELGEVGECLGRVDVVLIRTGERFGPDAQHVEPGLLTPRRDQRVAQVVDPRASRRRDRLLQLADVDGVAARFLEVQHEVQPGEHRLGEPRVPFVALRSVRGDEQLCDVLAYLGRVPVAGDEDQARHEPAVQFAMHEQANPAPLLQVQDAHRVREELVDVDLDEVVAWIRLEDLHEILLIVARR